MSDFKSRSYDFRIVHYSGPVADHYGILQTPSYEQYLLLRNEVVRICRSHGPVGGLGEYLPSLKSDATPGAEWRSGDAEPCFYVVEDQLNFERYIYIEVVKAFGVTTKWLLNLLVMLDDNRGWGIVIGNIHNGFIILLSGVILISGPTFEDCNDLASVVDHARKNVSSTA